jgi:hypothetical protein
VARIQRFSSRDTTRVKVTGSVSAADMGRLEHACAPALVTHDMDLEIDLRGATSIDRSAAAVLAFMASRGARILTRES